MGKDEKEGNMSVREEGKERKVRGKDARGKEGKEGK